MESGLYSCRIFCCQNGGRPFILTALKGGIQRIFSDYVGGTQVSELASRYFLSVKSIQRIIREQKE